MIEESVSVIGKEGKGKKNNRGKKKGSKYMFNTKYHQKYTVHGSTKTVERQKFMRLGVTSVVDKPSLSANTQFIPQSNNTTEVCLSSFQAINLSPGDQDGIVSNESNIAGNAYLTDHFGETFGDQCDHYVGNQGDQVTHFEQKTLDNTEMVFVNY